MTHHQTQNIILEKNATQLWLLPNPIQKLILATMPMAANSIFSQKFQFFIVLTKSVLMARSSFQLCSLWRRQAVMSAVDKAGY